jgi:hypothetical protein
MKHPLFGKVFERFFRQFYPSTNITKFFIHQNMTSSFYFFIRYWPCSFELLQCFMHCRTCRHANIFFNIVCIAELVDTLTSCIFCWNSLWHWLVDSVFKKLQQMKILCSTLNFEPSLHMLISALTSGINMWIDSSLWWHALCNAGWLAISRLPSPTFLLHHV